VRFKLDENLPAEIVELLGSHGHQVATVLEEGLSGEDDERIAEKARAEQRGIITADVDFANVRSYPPAQYAGIIVLRPRPQGRRALLALARELPPLLRSQSPAGKLWIVEPGRLRIHQGSVP
jgi:hypothetical protein